ncbi:hypothetical protein CANARDRAFT_197073 [[Candida] arabinofermentans NRRL YB-2248]|uniref:non-specific serine/threonine protein kinase n=1 Tax=[Candida] arabinofermentans NRRL YB-2248 TaxID=983967 RepID=A0A1E4T3F4_9ASCO|nr:hypothetical protein CANARDRAFT_197073 [[Candida] arabinofermentans NRRL YB-2248]
MGAELSLLAPTAQTIAVSAYIDFLDNIQYSKPLSSSRFLKTIRCLDHDGSVVVKLLIKSNTQLNLSNWVKQLEKLRIDLIDIPNVLPFQLIVDSSRAGYLVRPYIRYSLYERISIRPFLEDIEKKWIVYQLLSALSKLHSKNIYHGDLKTENVLVNSWGWCLICDFAPFKPVYLPEDNPSQFSFYFDTSQRHTCYLAPERFLSADDNTNKDVGGLTWEMDIFSLGCVIAELYMEGLSVFTLPQIFKYKKGEYTPNLDSVDDPNIRKLIQSMISLNPKDRLKAKDYLTQYRKNTFPDHFYTFLHPYMRRLANIYPDSKGTVGMSEKFKECDSRINKIHNDFDKIALYLGFKHLISDKPIDSFDDDNQFMIPLKMGLPGMDRHVPKRTSEIFNVNTGASNDCSCLIVLSVVLHSVRNTTHSSFRVKACDLILSLGEQLHDEAKLDRCLPYLIYMLDDPTEDVQSAALRCLTQLLTMVDVITPINVYIFPEYILPKLHYFLKRTFVKVDELSSSTTSPSTTGRYVRSVFAGCLPYLADVAKRFYEMSNLFRNQMKDFGDPETGNDFLVNNDSNLDVNYKNLMEGFENLTIQVLTDQDPFVRMTLLKNILPLSAFFGKEKTNDVILSHLITYLNDKNPQIRLSFVSSIVSISIFVGIISLEQYILPLLAQSLNDPDELVVISVLKVFTELNKLGLIRKHYLWDLVKLTIKLVLHPNEAIRQSVMNLIISIGDNLSLADLYCMLYPLIRPFFQYEVTDFSLETMYICTHKPVSRAVYNLSKSWSLRSDPTLFWQRVETNSKKTDSFGSSGISFMVKRGGKNNGSIYRLNNQGADDLVVVDNSDIPLSQFDMQQVEKLKTVGLMENELWKLATLRSYIYRVARSSNRVSKTLNTSDEEFKKMNILPRTVFIEVTHKSELIENSKQNANLPHLIAPTLTLPQPSIASDTTIKSTSKSRRPSSLLYGESNKAEPSILTNQETVFGETASASAATTLNFNDETLNYQKITTTVKHSYSGSNPYILKFLSKMKFDPTLSEYVEFGIPSNNQSDNGIKKSGERPSILIARLLEHKASISCIIVSPDHKFFITGDEQGYLKLWDSIRLETNVTGSSSFSINLGSPIKSLDFLKSRHCFAVSTRDGYIKIFRIELNGGSRGRHTSTSVSLIRHYKLDIQDGYANQIEFSVSDEKPWLLFTTPSCKLVVLDIRTMQVVTTLHNNLSHGAPTSFVIDSKQSWVLIGTSKGILDLWDLSFELSLKAVKFTNSNYAIKKIKLLPISYDVNGKRNGFVSIVGGSGESDVTIWDVSRLQPRQVLCSSSVASTLDTYSVTELNNESELIDEKLLNLSISDETLISDKSCTAETIAETSDNQLCLVAATSTNKIISWNLSNIEASRLITGGLRNPNLNGTPSFSSTQVNSNLAFCNERYTSTEQYFQSQGRRNPKKKIFEQQELIKNHKDVINDIILLQRPYEMVVSVDRSGVINVYR